MLIHHYFKKNIFSSYLFIVKYRSPFRPLRYALFADQLRKPRILGGSPLHAHHSSP